MPGRPTRIAARLGALRDHLGRSLFPVAPRGEPTLSRLEWTLLIASLLALAVVLDLLRLGFPSSLDTVWAEDGPIYLQAALTHGFFDAVFTPYAGYLVVVPRLIAEAATLAPLEDAPAVIAISSALVAALSGLAVWVGSGGLIRNLYLRGAIALAAVLGPAAGAETLDSAAYAPWYMLFATFWLLFWRPRTMRGAALAGAFVLLTGLSTPGVWFFIPVAALRALTIRNRRDATIVGCFALGAAIQIPVVVGQEQGAALWSGHIWTALVQRVIDGGVLGQRLGGGLWSHFGWHFLIALCAVLLVGLIVGLRRSGAGARWFVALALPTSFVMFVFSVYQRTVGPNIFWSPGSFGGTASRYVLVPALLLVSAGVVLVDSAVRRRGTAWHSWAVAATVAVLLVAIATSFDMSELGRETPVWKDSLTHAADVCRSEGGELAGVATSPPPFGVQLPCEQVASFARDGVSAGSASPGR